MLNLVLKPHRANLEAGTRDAQKIFALLKVIPDSQAARTRPPLAFCLVLDTSASMRDGAEEEGAGKSRATKLERMIEAAHAWLDDARLRPGDGVAIVRFDDTAHSLLPLSPLGDRARAHQALDSLHRYSGATHISLGLKQAAHELSDLPPRVVKRIVVLTDGETTDEPECRQWALQLGEANVPLVAIGLGATYNEELLRDLSEHSGGRPYHLRDVSSLRDVLGIEVSSSVREVVTDLRMQVGCVQGVALDAITRVYPSLAEVHVSGPELRLGNIAAGDYTVWTLEFTVSGMARPQSRARLARLALQGQTPGAAQGGATDVAEMFIQFTSDQAATVDVDAEVLGYVQQRNADRMVQEAVRKAPDDAPAARRILHGAVNLTRRSGNAGVTKMLQDALDEFDQTGAISPATRKTIALSGRTQTVKTKAVGQSDDVPSDENIRRMTGT